MSFGENLHQIALIGVGVFTFMAIFVFYSSVRTLKKQMRRTGGGRPRRLIASRENAESVARSVVREVVEKMEEEVDISRRERALSKKLEDELERARAYYLSRVEPRYRKLFSIAVTDIVFGRGDSEH